MAFKIPYYVHLMADFVTEHMIDDPKQIREILFTAAKKANNTPLKASVHKFAPHGITGVILLAESHIAIHSWPEYNYVAVDIFTCGRKTRPHRAIQYFKKKFKAKQVNIKEIKEG